jgi:hypothetical protein
VVQTFTDWTDRAREQLSVLSEFGHAFEGAHSVDARLEVPGTLIANPEGTPSSRAPQAAASGIKPLAILVGLAWVAAEVF